MNGEVRHGINVPSEPAQDTGFGRNEGVYGDGLGGSRAKKPAASCGQKSQDTASDVSGKR